MPSGEGQWGAAGVTRRRALGVLGIAGLAGVAGPVVGGARPASAQGNLASLGPEESVELT
jgi:hypothetical protein